MKYLPGRMNYGFTYNKSARQDTIFVTKSKIQMAKLFILTYVISYNITYVKMNNLCLILPARYLIFKCRYFILQAGLHFLDFGDFLQCATNPQVWSNHSQKLRLVLQCAFMAHRWTNMEPGLTHVTMQSGCGTTGLVWSTCRTIGLT